MSEATRVSFAVTSGRKRWTYRMTRDEFVRLGKDRDDLATEFTDIPARLADDVPAHRGEINLGYAGVRYDAGWYWVRTTNPIDWM